MRDIACQFGPERELAGVISEPQQPRGKRGVVLVSAGFTPKFGPFRMYVELARRLARDGAVVLRFDLGGIGDSSTLHAGLSLQERTNLQIQAAVDALSERFELDELILGGLCSGADDSFRYAEQDPRVTGLMLIDPFAYRTRGYGWRHVRYRAKRRLLRAIGWYRPQQRSGEQRLVDYEHVPRPEATRILSALLKRRVRLLFVYTAGMREHYNHPGQLRAMFPHLDFADLVRVEHLPELDHTQILAADRKQLIDTLVSGLAT
ncbi:serine aminopeptidase domain-containing protein [Haliangium ochraceum]|uniref:Serine aminopeptidase S33 domain-containing protein n=1 Tax=Haliangium ochraceum (strain DSM 14365 / JCM 11303 / SMP-2) TaxID=502025 RepID=D0LNU4_HALO1|nr:alpha/beta hydrolase [Haliangium ochraceum]ACY18770.1 hypothetical protein Hoch_6299 [Haliangium ochraceum DSM 14365]